MAARQGSVEMSKDIIEDLLLIRAELGQASTEIARLHSKIERLIITEQLKIGRTYGRCIKEFVVDYQSYEFNADDKTVIKVGDVVEFSSFPLSNSEDFTVCSGEFITIHMDPEFFEIFTSTENIETRGFR